MQTKKILFLITSGGAIYNMIELLYRGWTHWSMAIVGGLSFWLIFEFAQRYPKANILYSATVGMAIITFLELLAGIVVNINLGWNVWDYSHLPMNILGQVCLPFSLLWFLISMPGIWMCRWMLQSYPKRDTFSEA